MKRIIPWIATLLCLLMLICLLPPSVSAEDIEIVLIDGDEEGILFEEETDEGLIAVYGAEDLMPEEPEELRPFSGEFGWLRLHIDWAQMEEVGRQRGGQACACYSLAYCRTALDGEAHDISEYNLGTGEADAWCSWPNGDYVSHYYYNAYDVYEKMYRELCEGRPCVILVEGAYTSHHYIAILGFENVVDGQPLSANQFLMFDPCGYGDRLENMGAAGFRLNRLEGGCYQLVCDASGASAEREAHRSSYLSRCEFLDCRRTLLLRKGTELSTLPCGSAKDADAQPVCMMEAGERFSADALVKNPDGEYWYRGTTEDGETGYAFAGRFNAGREDFSDIRVEQLEAPVSLACGEAFAPRGEIRAEHALIDLSGAVYVGHGTDCEPLMSASLEGELRWYSLEGSEIAEALDFSSLTPGEYTYVISAICRSSCSTDGKTLRELEYKVRVISLCFTVGTDNIYIS